MSCLPRSLLALLFCVLSTTFAVAADTPSRFVPPLMDEPVVDQAGLLSARTVDRLSRSIRAFRRDGGAQIAVVTVETLNELAIEQATIKVVEAWKLGDQKRDDGVLLFVAKAERKARIEVGRGLEGEIPDAIAKRIVSDSVTPLFRSGEYDSGVAAGVYQIAHFANPQMDAAAYFGPGANIRPVQNGGRKTGGHFFLILIVVFFLLSLFKRGGPRMGGGLTAGLAGGLLGGMLGGGGGGGGGGSGGWGGGGGGFNGGGASGDW